MPGMNKLAPFLWFNDNAEEAAEFYLTVFPHARRLDELRSKGVGPWPVGKIATITIELEGQEMVFLNGGPAHQLNPDFRFSIAQTGIGKCGDWSTRSCVAHSGQLLVVGSPQRSL